MNACRPAFIDVADDAAELAAAAAVEVVEEPAAVGRTDAIATGVDAGVVEAVAAAAGSVVAVLVDAAGVEALADAVPPDGMLSGIAGVGAASRRMNIANCTMSELKSADWLALGAASVSGVGSSGSALSWQLASGLFR